MSAKMRGKKFTPSTSGSIVAADDHANAGASVVGARRGARDERLGRGLCAARGHGVGRRRPARPRRHPEHLAVQRGKARDGR